MHKTPFSILQVPVSATLDDVRQAYRTLARRFHPDVNDSPEAALRMKEINAARDRLSSEEKIAVERRRIQGGGPVHSHGGGHGRGGQPPRASRPSRGIVVSVEPRALVLAGRYGATASFTVRANGVSGDDIRCRLSSQAIDVGRRAAEFGVATFTVTALEPPAEGASPATVPVDVYVRRVLVHRLQVTLEPLEPRRAARAAASRNGHDPRADLRLVRSSLDLPGKEGCHGSFELAGSNLLHADIAARATGFNLLVREVSRTDSTVKFDVEVVVDLRPDASAVHERIAISVGGRRALQLAVTLTPVRPPRSRSVTEMLSFGKYRGQSFDWVAAHNPSYLRWMIDTGAGSSLEREAAERALDRLDLEGPRPRPSS